MHTYITNQGRPSPDGRYQVWITIHGAGGHAFTEKTKKRAWVFIRTQNRHKENLLSYPKHKFVGADVATRTRWLTNTNLAIDFYDWGDRVLADKAIKSGAPSNHITTLLFRFDERTAKFVKTE